MADLKKKHIEIITKDGECQLNISLEININLNTDGVKLKVDTSPSELETPEENIWAIPDFKSNKVKFGKKE